MLNIHPSLLPRHRGLHTHRRVLEAGRQRARRQRAFRDPRTRRRSGGLTGQGTGPGRRRRGTLAARVLAAGAPRSTRSAIRWFADGPPALSRRRRWLDGRRARGRPVCVEARMKPPPEKVPARPQRAAALTLHDPSLAARMLAAMAQATSAGARRPPAPAALQPYKARYQVSYRGISGGQIETPASSGTAPDQWQYEIARVSEPAGQVAVSPDARQTQHDGGHPAAGVRPLALVFDDGTDQTCQGRADDLRLASGPRPGSRRASRSTCRGGLARRTARRCRLR